VAEKDVSLLIDHAVVMLHMQLHRSDSGVSAPNKGRKSDEDLFLIPFYQKVM
jgi:hypothetical protein